MNLFKRIFVVCAGASVSSVFLRGLFPDALSFEEELFRLSKKPLFSSDGFSLLCLSSSLSNFLNGLEAPRLSEDLAEKSPRLPDDFFESLLLSNFLNGRSPELLKELRLLLSNGLSLLSDVLRLFLLKGLSLPSEELRLLRLKGLSLPSEELRLFLSKGRSLPSEEPRLFLLKGLSLPAEEPRLFLSKGPLPSEDLRVFEPSFLSYGLSDFLNGRFDPAEKDFFLSNEVPSSLLKDDLPGFRLSDLLSEDLPLSDDELLAEVEREVPLPRPDDDLGALRLAIWLF